MVGAFRRSISFPAKVSPIRPSKPRIFQNVRSISLPVRSHPLISQLSDDISLLRSQWLSGEVRSLDWLIDGLNRLSDLHNCFSEILQLPQTQDCLRRNRQSLVEDLQEDLLRFVEIYGNFRSSIFNLREHQAASLVAVRRKDETKIAFYLKSRRRIAKEIAGLSSSIRHRTKLDCHVITKSYTTTDVEAELVAVITEVIEATVAVSQALFEGLSSAFVVGKTTSSCASALLMRWKKVRAEEGMIEELKGIGGGESPSELKKMKGDEVRVALMKMKELEEGILGIESGSNKVFRSLTETRVTLLNIPINSRWTLPMDALHDGKSIKTDVKCSFAGCDISSPARINWKPSSPCAFNILPWVHSPRFIDK